MTDQEEILVAIGAVEEALNRFLDRLARLEKLVEQIALGQGIRPK